MVFIFSPYQRSATHSLKAIKATRVAVAPVAPKNPYTLPNLAALPTLVIQLILTNLTTPDLIPLLNTSRLLRTLARTCISKLRQNHLEHLRSLQYLNPAANLPTELLQEILSYLDPLDFYNTTRVCSRWRAVASWSTLVRKNVYAVQPPRTVPPSGSSDRDIKTLAFYLQCNRQLCGGMEVEEMKKAVTTLYLTNPGPEHLPGGTFSNDSGYGPGLGSKIQPYPEIHLSEDGHYFLSAETVFPFRVHVYCTYRPILVEDVESTWSNLGPEDFHDRDTTPTHLLTLPETGRVVSASFGKAVKGAVEFDKKARVYAPGVNLLVLFEGRQAQLYKIRSTGGRLRINQPPKRTLGGRLSSLMKLDKTVVERKPTYRWAVWDSMVFKDVCPLKQGPTKVKLGKWSEKAFFAGPGVLEVWEGVSDMKESKNRKVVDVWDKGAAKGKLIPIFNMPGKVCGIYTGRIWDSGVGADVDYIVCSNTIYDSPGENGESEDRRLPIWKNSTLSPGRDTIKTGSEMACTTIITPTQSLVFNYTNFMQIPGTGVPQFVCLAPPYSISRLLLSPTLHTLGSSNGSTDASDGTSHKPFALREKPGLGYPSTPPFSKIIHIAAINVPFLLPSGPIIVAATDSGVIYITSPPPCRYSGTAYTDPPSCPCASRLNSFRKVARIPPETGGRITDIRISYRMPGRTISLQLPEDCGMPKPDPGAMLVVVVATDRGRVEVCYFDFRNKRDSANSVKNRLEYAKTGRKWDLSGELVTPRA